MVKSATDPPSDERKTTEFWKRARRISRKLVNRQTLMIALRILSLLMRVVEMLQRLFGDL